MRIAIAVQNYFQPNNGQAVFTVRLAQGLAAAGHSVMVLTPSERGLAASQMVAGVRVESVTSLPLRPWYADVHVTLWPRAEVHRLFGAFRPEIVHVQDHFPLCRAVVSVARSAGLPIVGTNHFLPENIVPFVPVLSRFSWIRTLMRRFLWGTVLHVFRHVDVATSPTETAANLLRRRGLRAPVRAISCGVELDRFAPDPTLERVSVRHGHGIDPDCAVFLFVGRVDREKRLDILIEALQRVAASDIQVVIVGKGRDLAGLKALARSLRVGDQVHFTGFVARDELPALLQCADIFAMPSEAELQSIATLEAMAAGLPVLASDAFALPELVENGVNGYLFRSGDAEDAARRMEQLLAERDRWPEMGRASLDKARQHAVAYTIERYERLYAETLDAKRSMRSTAVTSRSAGSIARTLDPGMKRGRESPLRPGSAGR